MSMKFSELGPFKTGVRLVLAGLTALTLGSQTGENPGLVVQLLGSLVVIGGLTVILISTLSATSNAAEPDE